MKEVVSCILNILVTCLVSFLLNLHLVEKRRYRKLKRLNTELDILLKIAELEKQNPEVFKYVQSVIKQMYETAEGKENV